MRIFYIALMLLIGVSGCAVAPTPTPAPTGEWVWVNPELYGKADQGEITSAELRYEFLTVKSTCKVESLKIPVPSPSCSTIPYTCNPYTNFCTQPYQKCDYSSVNEAKKAKLEIFQICMWKSGWEQVWQPYNEKNTAPLSEDIKKE